MASGDGPGAVKRTSYGDGGGEGVGSDELILVRARPHNIYMDASPYPRASFFALPGEFDAGSFIAGLNEPEQVITARLSSTVRELTDELLQLIDKDHQVLLELTGDLSRVDATVTALRAPLNHLVEKMQFYKKVAAQPLDVAREHDERLADTRARQRMLVDKLHAMALREGVARDVAANDVRSAALRLALLDKVDAQASDEALRRTVENKLVESMDEPKSLVALAVLASADHARRALSSRAAHQSLAQIVSGHVGVLETAIDEGQAALMDFVEGALWPRACEAAGEVASVKEARALNAARLLLQGMSVSGGPHGPVRWNPRMYCELLFQEASAALEARRPLGECVGILYRDAPLDEAALEARMFRAACKLVAGFAAVETDPVALGMVARQVRAGGLLHSVAGWEAEADARRLLAEQLDAATASALAAAGEKILARCVANVKEHERAVTGRFRQTDKAFPTGASEGAELVLQPVREAVAAMGAQQLDLGPLKAAVFAPLCTAVRETLDTVVKREEGLLRLQRRAASSNEPSDGEKICAQMRFDVALIRSECIGLGAALEQVAALDA